MTPRIACLRVANLPLAAQLRAHPELEGEPLGVTTGSGSHDELIAVSPEAERRGVLLASSIAQARVACPALHVLPISPALEGAARAALLDVALGATPRATAAPPGSGVYSGEALVYLDASGVGSLFHSEAGFAASLIARATRVGLPGDVAIGSSRSIARIVARALDARERAGEGLSCVLRPEDEAAFLAPLPLDLFDLDDTTAEALTRFGVRNVEALLRLPRRALATRLGPEVLQLIALVRGEKTEPPLPSPERGALAETSDLEFPVARLEPLAFVVQGLLSRLLARLEVRHLACGDLGLALVLEGGARDARRIGVAAPTLDRRTLLRLICLALETTPPEAPVTGAALETEGHPLQTDQLDLFQPAGPAPAVLSHTLAELESLCGEGRVGAPAVADDHRPEAFSMRPFALSRRSADPVSLPERSAVPLAARALRPPVRAQVRIERGLPASVRSAVANGRVIHLAGPWRTSGGWWSREARFAYESFDVQTSDGTVIRLRHDPLHRLWQIDAVYD